MSDHESILVTGAAGFIGFHVARRLLDQGRSVIGLDNLSSYYDVRLKRARLAELENLRGFRFEQLDIADRAAMTSLFSRFRFPYVVHLAAQPGVRYSLIEPHRYAEANLIGFLNVLEGCRHAGSRHLVYASSSSVYGANTRTPFRATDNVDHPLSLYAATKKANELMAHAYAHLFDVPATGLRFFTVSGQSPNPSSSRAPWRIYNIGNNHPVELEHLLAAIEAATGRTAVRELEPIQPGDVMETYADIADLAAAVDFAPRTAIEDGVTRFVNWYRAYTGRQT